MNAIWSRDVSARLKGLRIIRGWRPAMFVANGTPRRSIAVAMKETRRRTRRSMGAAGMNVAVLR